MSNEVTGYWPDDFNIKVLSPLAVLRIQANDLSVKTHGLLEAEVVSAVGPKLVSHELQLVAPALGGERRTVLTVKHGPNEPYPATLEAAVFTPTDEEMHDLGENEDGRPVASTMQEFNDLVKRVIQSRQVRATAQSLLARSQELSLPA